ncbi:unnamed protein product, partial [Prorocentrum cordatum]
GLMASGRLGVAAAAGNLERLERLLATVGVDVDEPDEDGLTPLMAAARAGHLKAIHRLMRRSPRVDAADGLGRTALDHAVENGHADVVAFMTADTGDAAVVEELLTAADERLRADVNVRDPRGAPALHVAVRAGHAGVLSQLLQRPDLRANAR